MKHLGECILRCTTLRSDFEFQGLPILYLPSKVWEHCGGHIQSLYLLDSGVNDETMKNIIICCVNLAHLRIRYPFSDSMIYKDERKGRAFCSEKAIKEMVERKIVRNNLVSFDLFIDYVLSNGTFARIFLIFPQIRNLGRGFYSIDDSLDIIRMCYVPEDRWTLPSMIENFTCYAPDISFGFLLPESKYNYSFISYYTGRCAGA